MKFLSGEGKSKKIIVFFTQMAILLWLGFLVTQSIGLGFSGFDSSEVLSQYNFYIVAIGFALGLVCLFIVQLTIKKGDSKYGDSLAFSSPGETPAIPFFKRFTTPQLFILSTIIFSILGLFILITKQQTFTGFYGLEQQFTPTASLLFSSLLIPISENLAAAFFIGMSLFVLGFVARKYDMSKSNFIILSLFLIPIITGLYGVINHLLRYQGLDIALVTVFLFWAFGGLITILSGSFLPFLLMHLSNNLGIDIQRFFASDTILIISIGMIGLMCLLYFIMYRGRLFGKGKL